MGLTKTQSGGLADDAKTTINNNADNRVITGSGTANTLNGESNVIVDGSGNIKIGETNSGAVRLSLTQESNGGLMISQGSGTTPTNGQTIGDIGFSSYSDSQTNSSSEAMIRALASADHTGSSAPTDLLFFTKPSSTGPGSSPTERVRILAGGGLTFNGDTAAANALSDYEEGTFTITENGGISLTVYVAEYIKIGRMVHIEVGLLVATNSDSGAIQFSGLPFTAKNTGDNTGGFHLTSTNSGRNDLIFAIRGDDDIAVGTNQNLAVARSAYSNKQLKFSGSYTAA